MNSTQTTQLLHPSENSLKATLIWIGRNGHKIGEYYLDGIQKGLASGYFTASDYGWYAGLSTWLPLGDVVSRLTSSLPTTILPHPVRSSTQTIGHATLRLPTRLVPAR